MDIANHVRGYSFFSAVLDNRATDPFCRSCHSFSSSLMNARESVDRFERQHAAELETLQDGMPLFFLAAKSRISGIRPPEHPVGQKKNGKCRLPEGVCFLKSSLTLLEKIR